MERKLLTTAEIRQIYGDKIGDIFDERKKNARGGWDVYDIGEKKEALRKIEIENRNAFRRKPRNGIDCSYCNNTGFITVPYGRWVSAVRCDCAKMHKSRENIKKSGMAALCERYTFEKFKTEEEYQRRMLECASEFLKHPHERWLYFGGQPGSGKTHICVATAAQLIKSGREVKYMVWPEESYELKRGQNSAECNHKIEYLGAVDVLYIDDFLKTKSGEEPTRADIELAFRILNRRYNYRKTTIISSELYVNRITEIDEALGSRIRELAIVAAVKNDKTRNMRTRKTV